MACKLLGALSNRRRNTQAEHFPRIREQLMLFDRATVLSFGFEASRTHGVRFLKRPSCFLLFSFCCITYEFFQIMTKCDFVVFFNI